MFTLMSKVYNYFNNNNDKLEYQQKFEDELNKLEDDDQKHNERDVKQIVSTKKEILLDGNCFRKQGIITSLEGDYGIIDKIQLFQMSAATNLAELKIGFRVQYLAYKSSDDEHIKVVKIEQIVDDSWDKNMNDEVNEFNDPTKTDAEYFNMHQRSFLGQVITRNDNYITVDTDYSKIDIDLDTISLDYPLQLGDRVYLKCNVQTDQSFVDSAGEILEVTSVHPGRSKRIKAVITKLNDNWGVLDNDCFFGFDILPRNYHPKMGDKVGANVVECDRDKYSWRCTKIEFFERGAFKENKINERIKATKLLENKNGIIMSNNLDFSFENLYETSTGEITLKNDSEQQHKILKSVFLGKKSQSQLRLLEPKMNEQYILQPGQSLTYRLDVKASFYGYSKEVLVIYFEGFKIAREIMLHVGEKSVNDSKETDTSSSSTKRYKNNQYYAYDVWSKKYDMVPGVTLGAKPKFVANRIGVYAVPEHLKQLVLKSKNNCERMDALEEKYQSLTEALTFQNYTRRFELLLHFEEIEYFTSIRTYDRERAHFTHENEYLALQVENLAEKRPSLVAGDSIRVTNPWAENSDKRCYEGMIHKTQYNKLLIKFNPGFHSKYNGEDYKVEFFYSRYGFRKRHYACKKAVHYLGENSLFPSRIQLQDDLQSTVALNENRDLIMKGSSKVIEWFNPLLNDVQKLAIKNILRGEARPMPYIIFGPPGTGKTMTLVETILQLATLIPGSRLLVATPSNSSADLIATRLIGCNALKPGDFARLVSHNLVESDLIPEHLKPYCITLDISAEGTTKDSMLVTQSGLKLRCQMKHMGRHRITIGTCVTLGTLFQMGFPKGHFTHALLDEAGQSSEPEAMIPITQIDQFSGQVILAGDPMQLGPVILNSYAAEKGLRLSFLSRILDRPPYMKDHERFPNCGYDPRLVTKLIYNYRSLPSILKVYNDLFYDSELKPMIDETESREFEILNSLRSILPNNGGVSPYHGVFFFGIRGENRQDMDSPSWYNAAEAKSIFLFIIKLYKQKIPSSNIGIITPYQKQVKMIRNIFIEANINLPKIGSVEEFQGQERDIILISTVRSSKSLLSFDRKHALGFVSCSKRMNVGISRARALLVVFGNPHLLSMDPSWEYLIKYCIANDCYTGCDLPINLME